MKYLFFFVFFCFWISSYYVQAADTTIMLYLPLDENQGKVAIDLSAYKNDATLKGNAKWTPGKYGSGIDIATGNWLEVRDSDSLDLTEAMTINCWVLIRGLTGDHQSAVEKGAAWAAGEYNLLPCYNPDSVLLQMNDLPDGCDDEALGGKVNDGSWHFIAGTWDGKVIKTYVDGKETSNLACAGTLMTNNDPLYIGSRGGSARWMNGLIDEIKMYNRALSANELKIDMEDPTANLVVKETGKLAATWGSLKAKI